ncbi:MAG: Gldg family protein [Clostridia bacterium]|nr:Gldg family protein [Clostridia bacterium]
MKTNKFRTRASRHVQLTAILTSLVIAVTVLTNAVVQTLAERYSWYSYMTSSLGEYQASGTSLALTDAAMAGRAADAPPIEIIFCDLEKNILADAMHAYVYDTAGEIAQRYPQSVLIRCYDVTLNPNTVRRFLKMTDPVTGEEIENTLDTTGVIISCGDYFRVYSLNEFYAFREDSTTAWAYNGERRMTAGILQAISQNKPVACFLENHGEVFFDYELMSLLDDAGYALYHLDLQTESIPENCSLIISYNPATDLVSDTVSAVSEVALLQQFLSVEGNSFLTFIGADSPALPNMEAFLSDWGVEFGYYRDSVTGSAYRYTVQDSASSLTSDGYTVYGNGATAGRAKELIDGNGSNVVFRKATVMRAAQGFVNNADGSYQKGNRVLYNLYESAASASAWANGAARDGGGMLMTLTEQKNAGGSSYVGVVSSVDFASEKFLQSAVYSNGDSIFGLMKTFGKENVPQGLRIQPFNSQTMSTVTMAQKWGWTLGLTLIPAAVITTVATVVLLRRRRA